MAQLPIKPFTVDRAAAIWKLDKATAQNMLEDLAGRAMLLDMEQNGQADGSACPRRWPGSLNFP